MIVRSSRRFNFAVITHIFFRELTENAMGECVGFDDLPGQVPKPRQGLPVYRNRPLRFDFSAARPATCSTRHGRAAEKIIQNNIAAIDRQPLTGFGARKLIARENSKRDCSFMSNTYTQIYIQVTRKRVWEQKATCKT